MIRITSKRDGFRRCGIAHPKGATEYPDDRFSQEQLETLKAEPMLVVEEIEGGSEGGKADPGPESMTVAQLKEELADKTEIPANAKKADLVELVKSEREKKE